MAFLPKATSSNERKSIKLTALLLLTLNTLYEQKDVEGFGCDSLNLESKLGNFLVQPMDHTSYGMMMPCQKHS